jgi:adenylate cyclase
MKRCPECRRDYYDDTLLYCLDDGNALLEGPASGSRSEPPAPAGGQFGDEPATAILSEPGAIATGFPASESPTRAQINTTDQTAILRTGAEAEHQKHISDSSERQSFSANRAAKPLVGAIAVGLILVGGFFGYRYFNPAVSEQISSIAVLPFENRSGSADTDYLSDGLAESLIYRLSQLPNLKVSPTSSVLRYKGSQTDVAQIAKELEVDAVMSGRLAQRGDDLMISVELIDARTKKLIWAEQYDRKMSDLLATQREIAREIAEALKIQVSRETGLTKDYTSSNDAYKLHLQGRFLLDKRSKSEMNRALNAFRKAILLDPNFALAYVGIADTYNAMVPYGYIPPREGFAQAKDAAKRALEIDSSLAEAHSAYAVVLGNLDWNWTEAEREHKYAIDLAPNREGPYYYYATTYLLQVGRTDEAAMMLKRAIEFEPLSLNSNARLATAYTMARKYDLALEQSRRTMKLDPNFIGIRAALMEVLMRKGLYDEAIKIGEDTLVAYPRQQQIMAALGLTYARAGRADMAAKILSEFGEMSKTQHVLSGRAARISIALGDRKEAFEWLDKAFRDRDWYLPLMKTDAEYDEIRDDPRFKDLLKRMNLPE